MSQTTNPAELAAEHAQLKQEIEKIAQYIQQAKVEILSISLPESATGTDKNLSHAANELEEVVRHTEEATNVIMDQAEAIMRDTANMGDEALGQTLNNHALGILEACSFQDITGQRIRKVLKTLEQVELRLTNLITLFGGTLPQVTEVSEIQTTQTRADEALLNGPQLSKNAPSQEEIDKLFSSL
jgi:chemotaxis protein CheZ